MRFSHVPQARIAEPGMVPSRLRHTLVEGDDLETFNLVATSIIRKRVRKARLAVIASSLRQVRRKAHLGSEASTQPWAGPARLRGFTAPFLLLWGKERPGVGQ